jgi:hypothetical protein
MEDLYPKILVSLRILLTFPVSVASSESFSKLKLIETCLGSSVSQKKKKLSALATLSTENTNAQILDFSELVKIFGDVKARKVNFQ